MRTRIIPFGKRRIPFWERRMIRLLMEELENANKVPMERLNREARIFERDVLSKLHSSEEGSENVSKDVSK